MEHSYEKPRKADRACRPCRDLKVRCLLDAGGGKICQKCQKSGACCVFEEPKERKKRKAPDDRITVEALEAKLAELAKQLEKSKEDHQLQKSASPAHGPSVENASSAVTPSQAAPSSGLGLLDENYFEQDDHVIDTMLRNGILSINAANECLLRFQDMSHYFPFVMLLQGATIECMREKQPFLLHAVLAVTSRRNHNLRTMLGISLRQRLMKAVMIEGEKSIDLLQALILCLAWEHFFYIPKKLQSTQMLQVAISMCVEMGLDERPCEAASRMAGTHLDHHYSTGGEPDDPFFSKAARRVYIGCYFLSVNAAWIWRKPSYMQFTDYDYLAQCAQSLSEDPEYDTDTHILPLLEIQRVAIEYHELFLLTNPDYWMPNSSELFQSRLEVFQAKIKQAVPTELSECLPVKLAAQYAIAHACEMDTINPCLQNIPRSLEASPASQVPVLKVCLEASKSFVETFLSFPLSEYSKLSGSQWWGLVSNVVILYRLAIGTPQLPHWDVNIAREKFKLEIYLELLSYRVQGATECAVEAPRGRDMFSLMGAILANVKDTYERLKKLPQAASSMDGERVHGMALDEFREKSGDAQAASLYKRRCPAFSFRTNQWKVRSPSPTTHDDLCALFDSIEPDSLVDIDSIQDDGTWLDAMPELNLVSNTSGWNPHMP